MRKRRNLILIAVLLMNTSISLTACKESDGSSEQDTSVNSAVSDEPIEYDADYVEDDETMADESSEGTVDGHEDEAVIDESGDMAVVPEEESEY